MQNGWCFSMLVTKSLIIQDAYAVPYEPIYSKKSQISRRRGISSVYCTIECRKRLIRSYLIIESSGISEPIQASYFGIPGNLS